MAAGRPRSFDPDEALEKALHVFWQKGYEGTSMPDLTEAMGINRPSLYAAFGNKEQLFYKALDKYSSKSACAYEAMLNAPTARASVEQLLRAAADAQSNPDTPKGCLIMHGALVCGDEAHGVQQELARRRAENEALLRQRFERAVAEGEKLCCGPADMARYVSAVLQGISVQGASGATREALHGIVDATMQRWPD